ncbi:hypothetical protein SAY86_004914 [Trapa natans]|uniref:ACT domain-containing protein n=1 Tax=Trapa natans TaxID=22666 RepID=A0AAN7RID0_TRANT|nr:hypothetical protein SAY86_004914 [Trapa natans]
MLDSGSYDGRAYNGASTAIPSPSRSPPAQSRWMPGKKLDVYNEVLRHSSNEEAILHGFEDELYDHFFRLPTRYPSPPAPRVVRNFRDPLYKYTLDVNIERAEDVLMHKKNCCIWLLIPITDLQWKFVLYSPLEIRLSSGKKLSARIEILLLGSFVLRKFLFYTDTPVIRPGMLFFVGVESWRKHLQPDYTSAIVVNASLHLIMKRCCLSCFVHNHQLGPLRLSIVPTSKVQSIDSVRSGSLTEDASQDTANCANRKSIHPLPAFSLLSNLEVLALEAVEALAMEGPMHEITFSTDEKPKLLSQLTCLLSDMGLNIQEAHVFSTADGYSLNVFVVDGGPYEETEKLATAIEKEVCKRENAAWLGPLVSSLVRNEQTGTDSEVDHVPIPTDGSDVWEIDVNNLKFGDKVVSGSYGDLYRGTYRSQDVAIKVLKSERLDADLQREFAQEVSMMKLESSTQKCCTIHWCLYKASKLVHCYRIYIWRKYL